MNADNRSEQYRRMNEIVGKIMDQNPDQWVLLAAEACKGDEDLEALVLDVLLQMQEKTGLMDISEVPKQPETLGPYRIIRPLGQGGMGIVYLAERMDQFHQKVAIKCLRSEFAKQEDITRFHRERQILAKLKHPHIATILDGGVTDRGMPFFVMEYVEGLPLTKYAREHKLQLKQRLQIFKQICAAVHYANQNLIVHRDLKPSNILVNGAGQVKLLDFGIAKLLGTDDPHFSGMTILETETGRSLMTLQYASPEQYQGHSATVATDVHALGLVLYELLVGKRAYALKDLPRSQVADVILRQLPLKPSRALNSDADPKLQAPFETRHGFSPKWMQTKLKGDLDCIVMKALRKEPERRYGSASEMISDIDAYLAGMPVSAHPEKWSYHFSKFVSRNKLLVGFVGFGLVSLLALALLSLRFAQVTQAKNIQIAQERDQAEAISQFLVHVLEESEPLIQNANPSLKDVLTRAKNQLDENIGIDSEARLALNLKLISLMITYEMHDEAEALIGHVIASNPPEDAQTVIKGYQAVLHGYRSEFAQAWPLYEEAISALEIDGDEDILASLKLLRGIHWIDAAAYDKGLAQLQSLLAEERELKPAILISAWRNLGRGYAETGQFEQAEMAFDEAENFVREHFGDQAMSLYDIDLNRILVVAGRGDFEKALAMADQAIPQLASVLGENHSIVCGALLTKATCLAGLGRLEEALPLRLRAFDCTRSVYGPEHHQIVYILSEIGVNYSQLGKKQEALGTYQNALSIAERVLPPGHLFTSYTHANLGSLLVQLGKPEESLIHTKKAYESIKTNPSNENHQGAYAFLYGKSLQSLARHEEAISHFQVALEIAEKYPNHIQYIPGMVYQQLAPSYRALGQKQALQTALEKAFANFFEILGPNQPQTRNTYDGLVKLYEAQGNTRALNSLVQRMNGSSQTTDKP